MKRYIDILPEMNSEKLTTLLNQRRLPLTKEGEQQVLSQLPQELAKSVFIVLAIPTAFMQNATEVPADQIDRVNLLKADHMTYLPAFTDMKALQSFGFPFDQGAQAYLADILDFKTFLDNNGNVDAIVINPGIDDLLLTDNLISSMLQMPQI